MPMLAWDIETSGHNSFCHPTALHRHKNVAQYSWLGQSQWWVTKCPCDNTFIEVAKQTIILTLTDGSSLCFFSLICDIIHIIISKTVQVVQPNTFIICIILAIVSTVGLHSQMMVCVASIAKQEVQLSQWGRTMLCVIKYFAKPLKITWNDTLE